MSIYFYEELGETSPYNKLRRDMDYYSDDEIEDYFTHYFDDEMGELNFDEQV